MKSEAVIIADAPLGPAIGRALSLFSINSVCLPPRMVQDLAAGCSGWTWRLSAGSAKEALYECRAVFAVDFERRGPSDIVALVHLLRGRWLGDARFVALLHSQGEMRQLVECDLFGEPGGAFAFGKMPGHSALIFPLNIVELLHEVDLANAAEGRMTAASWMIECADRASALKVVRNLRILQGMDWGQDPEAALAQGRELVHNLHAAKWDAQLFPNDHRTGPELAKSLLEQFPANRELRVADLAMVCEKTHHIIEMSVFGCLKGRVT